MRQIEVGTEKYSFVAIDACLQPGPRRPFNFVGALDAVEIKKIHRLVAESRKKESDYIFWFGHYPTSCIIAQCEDGVRSMIGEKNNWQIFSKKQGIAIMISIIIIIHLKMTKIYN